MITLGSRQTFVSPLASFDKRPKGLAWVLCYRYRVQQPRATADAYRTHTPSLTRLATTQPSYRSLYMITCALSDPSGRWPTYLLNHGPQHPPRSLNGGCGPASTSA